MAKIDALPSLEVINTLKGTLDYYYWKGIPCVRKWPHIPHSSRTQPSLDSAHLFGLIVQGWALVGGAAKTLYTAAAADQPKTGRDLYVSGVLGGQHEASMSDFLDLLIECKDYLADLQALLGPLGSVNTDDLQIDIKSALATLPVKGEDQLFSFLDTLEFTASGNPSGANGFLDSPPVQAGEIWVITHMTARDATRALTELNWIRRTGGSNFYFDGDLRVIALGEFVPWHGFLPCTVNDVIRIYFTGAQAADTVSMWGTGYKMTLET